MFESRPLRVRVRRPVGTGVAFIFGLAMLLAACGGTSSPTSSRSNPGASSDSTGSVAAGQTPGVTASGANPGSAATPAGGGATKTAAPAASAAATNHPGSTPGIVTSPGSGRGSTAGITVDPSCRKAASSVGSGIARQGLKYLDFTATTFDCHSLTLSKVISGHSALINFFASWCEPCKGEAPDLAALYKEYHDSQGFQIVPVDTKDEAGNPSPFYTKYGYTFDGVWDDSEKIFNAYSNGISSLPVLVWVKCDGTIDQYNAGSMSRSQMEAEYKTIKC
jgi:thiol-disulfide isomerase/thioredoxin